MMMIIIIISRELQKSKEHEDDGNLVHLERCPKD